MHENFDVVWEDALLTKLLMELSLMTLPNLLDSLDSRGETEWGVCLSVSSVALSCVAMGDVEADVVDELRGKS